MKKIGYIGLLIGFIILINTESKAQYYYTSYGYGHEWQLPNYIHHSIYDNYYGYEIAHVKRYKKHGHRHFNVMLHRNGLFIELKLDHHGHIYKTIKHRYYNPLNTHICTNHCGYHRAYYQAYYPNYHKHHHGYSTTVYVNTNKGQQHKHKNYYSNVYIEQPKTKTHYKNNAKNSQQSNMRQSEQRNTKQIEHRRSNSGNRSSHQVVRQNTSRGRTRVTVAQNNERSSRNR